MELKCESQKEKGLPLSNEGEEAGIEEAQEENGRLDLCLNVSVVVSSCSTDMIAFLCVPLWEWLSEEIATVLQGIQKALELGPEQ